jgi:hypothetical protein
MKRKNFKLYHITNIEFLPSIREHGLGARDPIKDNNLLEILKYFYDLCEIKIPNDQTVASHRAVTQIIIKQSNEFITNPFTSANIKPNFLHRNLYLSSLEDKAITFALCTRYGSEVLTRVLTYINVLDHYKIRYEIERFKSDLDLESLSQKKPKLVLIKFDYFEGLNLEIEECDNKTELEEKFLNIMYFNEKIEDKIFASQLQFKTSEIIPSSKLTFYELRLYNVPNEEIDYSLINM